MMVIVQDAFRRAGMAEKDGLARYGGFDRQLELAADEIIAVLQGVDGVDERIKSILTFNRVV